MPYFASRICERRYLSSVDVSHKGRYCIDFERIVLLVLGYGYDVIDSYFGSQGVLLYFRYFGGSRNYLYFDHVGCTYEVAMEE